MSDALGGSFGGPVSTVISVEDESQVGAARRGAAALAVRAGLGETERGALALIVTEAATNLARHAIGGMVALRILGDPPTGGVEILALDKGPGIHDLTRAMADGYSTTGTAGHGMGAIRRMANEFDIYSSAESGTALLARIWSASANQSGFAAGYEDGVVCVPREGESACGDGWSVVRTPHRVLAVVVDGLGHGVEAARAADETLRIVRELSGWPAARIIEAAHGQLHATRGAALAIAEIALSEQIVRFAAVGNISGAIVSGQSSRGMASYNGTVGVALHKVHEVVYPWQKDDCLILHSDGIMTRWRLEAYPGLVAHHPALVAGVLFRDFNRGRDDATVLAVSPRRV